MPIRLILRMDMNMALAIREIKKKYARAIVFGVY